MSSSNWMCEGIGVTIGEIYSFLDADRLRDFMQENNLFLPGKNGFDPSEYQDMDNEERLEYLESCANDNLECILKAAEAKNLLVDANNGDGERYLLYAPRYPWNHPEDLKTEDEVKQYILDLLMRFTLADISGETIFNLIDYIYEPGSN